MEVFWTWVAAFLTLSIYSFLYKDNPFYKFAEHLLVGVSVGYSIAVIWHNTMIGKVYNPLVQDHQWWVILPTLLGSLMFSRFVRGYAWISRIPIAFVMGASSGMAIPAEFQALIFKQVQGTIQPTITFGGLIVIIGVISTLVYFYFSKEHRGFIGGTAKVGIVYIMVAFGAAFGYTVMARVSLLIGRMQFLLYDWLHIIK